MTTPDDTAAIIAFAWLALAMTLAPGSDTVFVIRSSLQDAWRAGVVAALGIVCGVVVWGALAGLGVALLLVRFPVAYDVVAVAGGIYLGYLAWGALVSARRSWRGRHDAGIGLGLAPTRSLPRTFGAGLLANLLNPKIGVFYLSVMPGLFVGSGVGVWTGLLLGGIHAAMGVVWLSLVAVLSGWARRSLLRPTARAVLDGVCGLLLLSFGVLVVVGVLAGGGAVA
ncbi:LysE family translocator [Agromyces seonyuensis]|uniref:LysE family transporter n=1 Tax=Agromyces seonyuensis TaxID=2662446 RepID=A0A6I4P5T1_9MICO|nr:LysE family translocator [Agromyces seonyuensis]MWB98824.1 LysE family transporter [Agromyces seonyuensis]